jgi:NAD(P)-dependent dehydrogenase (short-subunit alcohol dehydrogenase family)
MEQQKIAIITGGSRGIGAATSLLFAKHGYAVCINYKSKSAPAEQLAQLIREQGGRCITVQANVAVE